RHRPELHQRQRLPRAAGALRSGFDLAGRSGPVPLTWRNGVSTGAVHSRRMTYRPRPHASRIAPRATLPPPLTPSPEQWSALFGPALSAPARERLQSAQQMRTLATGQLVFPREQRARDLVAVLEGSVGLGQRRDDMSFDLQRSVTGPQWLDLSSA